MKNHFYLLASIVLVFSCSEEQDTETDNIEINTESVVEDSSLIEEGIVEDDQLTLGALLEDNPTRALYESYLNTFYEPFEEVPFEETELQSSELVYGYSQFRTKESKTTVKFYFADHQDDLIEFGNLNFVEGYYGVNGAGLFLVSGEDEQAVNDVLSWFSGAE